MAGGFARLPLPNPTGKRRSRGSENDGPDPRSDFAPWRRTSSTRKPVGIAHQISLVYFTTSVAQFSRPKAGHHEIPSRSGIRFHQQGLSSQGAAEPHAEMQAVQRDSHLLTVPAPIDTPTLDE
jgi:hypothetical protein